MKIKYLFTALAAALTLFTSCSSDEDMATLDSVQVSQSYISLQAAGGSATMTVKANSDWEFTDIPAWLTISPEKGGAGETEITFSSSMASIHTNGSFLLLKASCTSLPNSNPIPIIPSTVAFLIASAMEERRGGIHVMVYP